MFKVFLLFVMFFVKVVSLTYFSYLQGLISDSVENYEDFEIPSTINENPVGLFAVYETLKREFQKNRYSHFPIFPMSVFIVMLIKIA